MGQPASPLIVVACSSLGPSLSTEARSLVDEVCCQAHSCSSSHVSKQVSIYVAGLWLRGCFHPTAVWNGCHLGPV